MRLTMPSVSMVHTTAMNIETLSSMSFMSNAISAPDEVKEKLQASGTGTRFLFQKGMKLSFLPLEETVIIPASFKNSKGDLIEYLKLPVWVETKSYTRWSDISLANFRRKPLEKDLQDYLAESAIVSSLLGASNDYERLVLLAGKTIVVKDIVEYKLEDDKKIYLPVFKVEE